VAGLLVVSNAAAGGAAAPAVQQALAVLRAGADTRVVSTRTPQDLDDLVAEAAGRRPVVIGGDGSVHAIVGTLYRTRTLETAPALGLIPLGTGNDLARTAGIPLDPVAAARVVLDGTDKSMELLVDDAGGVVVNAVHLGIGAEAGRVASRWKSRLGKAAYAMGSVIAGSSSPGWRVRVEANGEVLVDVDQRVLMVGLGLGSSIGGGSPLAPSANPADGLVDVVISAAVGPLARLTYAIHLRRGDHVHRPDVRLVRARQVVVSGQPFMYNADGEIAGPVRRRSWTVRPDAWRLLVPKTEPKGA
jgi:YegS/Rv2252/BmrU family lipid kinase